MAKTHGYFIRGLDTVNQPFWGFRQK